MKWVIVEPDRYGRTGIGVGAACVRSEWRNEAVDYCLDAPAFLARGSVTGRDHDTPREQIEYISHTIHRP
jgi:hypothetical protein